MVFDPVCGRASGFRVASCFCPDNGRRAVYLHAVLSRGPVMTFPPASAH